MSDAPPLGIADRSGPASDDRGQSPSRNPGAPPAGRPGPPARRRILPPFIEGDTSRVARPLLCVVVDTEEDFDWSGPFSRRNLQVSSLARLPRGHALFRRFGLQPIYLVDYPVITHADAASVFGPWLAAGQCVIGAQLHPWVTPPHEEVVCLAHSFPCNLPPELERRKLELLTERIVEVLGVPPRVYKAGRYGLDLRLEPTLRALGYTLDTSVLPFRDNSGLGGGPDFFGFPERPFWTSTQRELLYLPVTQSLVGLLRGLAHTGADRWAFSRVASRLHLPGLLARLRLLERIMLTPEGSSLEDMKRLTLALAGAGHRVFALSLHSPSLAPGCTPYVRSPAELEAFLAKTERFLEFFMGELGGAPVDPLTLGALLRPA